jgi:HAD superfamily hydrolase (TIGR01490 family)
MASAPKTVAFFDVDNTLLRGSTLYLLGKGMYRKGFFTKREISNYIFVNLLYRFTGVEDQNEISQITKAACKFVKGHKVEELEKLGAEVYDQYVSPALWSGTIELAQKHLAQKSDVWLLTASSQELASLIAARLGFTGALGTQAKIKDGVYTGELESELLHGNAKATAALKLAADKNYDLNQSFAYSDSHHDLPLLKVVGKPAVINPDATLRLHANKSHWPIYDFRRGRWIKSKIAPMVARIGSLLVYLRPGAHRR